MTEKTELTLQEELDQIFEREDLFKQGYKPKQKLEITGELFSKLLGLIGEQNNEITHLKNAFSGINMFISHMEQTNNSLAIDVLKLHAKNIDKKITHEVK